MANDPLPRGLRDEATVGPDASRARNLQRLSELRYEVADGEPDVRGWVVYASTGREIGSVADLLVDPDAGEVVMLDVDLRRDGHHTYAPIRAAWIDHATRRVVLDAQALVDANAGPAAAAPVASAPTAMAAAVPTTPPTATPVTDAAPGLPMLPRSGPLSDADIQRFDAEYVRLYGDRAADRDATWRVPRGTDDALEFAPRRLIDPAANTAPEPVERRVSRVDDASALDEDAAIDPRELDARVRIDEGATVDDAAPVGGVRYEGEERTPHDYGSPDDAYGPGHGSGRIGFNKVVSHGRSLPDAAEATRDATRVVRYRQYDDRYAGPDAAR